MAAVVAPYQLAGAWRARADLFRLHGAEPHAAVLEALAAELEAALVSSAQERLSLAAASAESGYSISQLRRMIRERKVPNAGAVGTPLIRRSDLPRKPQRPLDPHVQQDLSSKRQIARAVAAGR
jgi:hypothetical protein